MPKVVPIERTLGFVWKDDPTQVGAGLYAMNVCFPKLGVHVSYQVKAYDGDESTTFVENPVACDGSCVNRYGVLEDFWNGQGDRSCYMREIARAAAEFSALKS